MLSTARFFKMKLYYWFIVSLEIYQFEKSIYQIFIYMKNHLLQHSIRGIIFLGERYYSKLKGGDQVRNFPSIKPQKTKLYVIRCYLFVLLKFTAKNRLLSVNFRTKRCSNIKLTASKRYSYTNNSENRRLYYEF